MIYRNKLINEIKAYHQKLKPAYISKLVDAEINDIIDIINEQPEVSMWISVEDRLPDKPIVGEDNYIVQIKHVIEPCSAYWNGEYWTDLYNDVVKDVIAWMPLPEPFKE